MIEVRFDIGGFVRWLNTAREHVRINAKQTLGQGVALGVAHAKATTKFKDRTGELRKSIDRVPHGEWGWKLRATAKHARYVESGTKAHEIVARRRRALRFIWHGELTFRKRVWHPGTKPTNFMDEAATVAARFLDYQMEEALRRALR